jgi:hypothetical protein
VSITFVVGCSGAERGSVLSGIGGVGGPRFRGGCLFRLGSAGPTGSLDFVASREELKRDVGIKGAVASLLAVVIERIGKVCVHRVSRIGLLIARQSRKVEDLVKDAIDGERWIAMPIVEFRI